MIIRNALIGFCALIVGCVSTPTNSGSVEGALSPSEILADRENYEGQVVLVRGFLSIEPDSICLIDPEHSGDADPPMDSLFSVLDLDRLKPSFDRFNGKVIVFRARFKSKIAREDQFLLHGCGRSGVQIESGQVPVVLK